MLRWQTGFAHLASNVERLLTELTNFRFGSGAVSWVMDKRTFAQADLITKTCRPRIGFGSLASSGATFRQLCRPPLYGL